MAAGVTDRVWGIGNIAKLFDERRRIAPVRRPGQRWGTILSDQASGIAVAVTDLGIARICGPFKS